jgi:excisionase family DNA binding protein
MMNDEHAEHDKYLTKQGLAVRLRVTTRTVESWMAKGLIPFRKIGRTVRFDWSDVRDHFERVSPPAMPRPGRMPGKGIASSLRQRAQEIRKAEAQKLAQVEPAHKPSTS